MYTNLKNDRYGSLLFFEGRNQSDDPFKNYKILKRRGVEEIRGSVRFSTPDDKDPVKVSRFMFLASMDVDSNFVPINDWHARSVQAFQVRILDNEIDATASPLEYTFASFYAKNLNFSTDAKEVELFPSGTYDSRAVDACDLSNEICKHNGKNLVENRQSYAQEIWKDASQKLNFDTNDLLVQYQVLKHRYNVRTPIAHGLCRQPRVIPSDSRLQFEIRLNPWNQVLQRHDDYRICRVAASEDITVESLTEKWPLNSKILTEMKTFRHYSSDECNCVELKTKYGDNFTIHQVKEGNALRIIDESNPADVATLYSKEKWTPVEGSKEVLKYFQAHEVTLPTAKVRKQTFSVGEVEKEMLIFWIYNKDGPEEDGHKLTDAVTFYDHVLEAVYCTPGKSEKPFSVKGGGARIPFLSPKLKIVNQQAGQRSYEIVLRDGKLPHMLILTGMSYKRRSSLGVDTCATKTCMFEAGFEIEEVVIYIDNNEAFRSPWRAPVDFYINYLKHTGRYFNKAIGGSVDYFRFQNENWCIPLRFDDRARRRGLVTAKITFRKELESSWDAFITKIPVADLMLDSSKNGKSSVCYCSELLTFLLFI